MEEFIRKRYNELIKEGYDPDKAYYRAAVEWVMKQLAKRNNKD